MYGLIGKKIGHSFSAEFFNKKFKREGVNNTYNLFPLESIDEFPKLLKEKPEIQGLNVTIPYKIEIIPFLDYLSPDAKEIGAVNVIKIERSDEGTWLGGYNSDYIGFLESLKPYLNDKIKNALVLGTGGASKAVAYALKKLNIKPTFVSRNPDKEELSYSQLDEGILSENFLIVNTTPLGMFPDVSTYPSIPYHLLTPQHVCYDLVYNPLKTEFLRRCEEQGTTVVNGIEMLELQALAAWDIWNK